jgi:hypothetical protein
VAARAHAALFLIAVDDNQAYAEFVTAAIRNFLTRPRDGQGTSQDQHLAQARVVFDRWKS